MTETAIRIPKLVIVGYSFGILTILCGIARYLVQYNDVFKFLVVLAVGGLVLLFSYLYSWMKRKDINDDKIEERLDAMATWFVGAEKETIADIARGKVE